MITISADDSRSIKALEIAAGASSWMKIRSIHGELGYGIPSQCAKTANRYYLVTETSCDCEDFKRTGLTGSRIGAVGDHGLCKHIRALRLFLELKKAQQLARRPSRAKVRLLRAVPTEAEYEMIETAAHTLAAEQAYQDMLADPIYDAIDQVYPF